MQKLYEKIKSDIEAVATVPHAADNETVIKFLTELIGDDLPYPAQIAISKVDKKPSYINVFWYLDGEQEWINGGIKMVFCEYVDVMVTAGKNIKSENWLRQASSFAMEWSYRDVKALRYHMLELYAETI